MQKQRTMGKDKGHKWFLNQSEGMIKGLLLFTLQFSCFTLSSAQQEWEDKVIPQLEEMARLADDNSYYTSICVYDLTFDAMVFGYNENKKMRPASTQKLVTSISALDQLGADYQFRTDVYQTGEVVTDANGKKVLHGDIYIVGGMDPLLKESQIQAIGDSLVKRGISMIDGKIYADMGMKDTISLGNGWCWDDENPTLSPITFLPKTINIKTAHPQNLRTSVKTYPGGGRLVCSFSHSLNQVLQGMMKDSNNQHAECMLYQLGRQVRQPCTFKDCLNQIMKTVAKTGHPKSAFEIKDGSGLSLYNYITTRAEVALLRYASQTPWIFSHLYPALPIAGVDGTLKSRMKGTSSYHNIHAKTGTVSHVISLAGYLISPTNHLIAFSIISNGCEDKSEARAFHDRICNILTTIGE